MLILIYIKVHIDAQILIFKKIKFIDLLKLSINVDSTTVPLEFNALNFDVLFL